MINVKCASVKVPMEVIVDVWEDGGSITNSLSHLFYSHMSNFDF